MMKYSILVGIFYLVSSFQILAQPSSELDSLVRLLGQTSNEDSRLSLLSNILNYQQTPDSTLMYAEELLTLSRKRGNTNMIHRAMVFMGNTYENKGDLDKALQYHLESLSYATSDFREGITYGNIGNIYKTNRNTNQALHYFNLAINLFKKTNDSLRLGTTYISVGYLFYELGQLDSAEVFQSSAKQIFSLSNHQYAEYYEAYALGNLALIKAKKGLTSEAEQTLKDVIETLIKYNDQYAISDYKLQLAKIYYEKSNYRLSIEYGLSGLELAILNGLKEQIRNGHEIMKNIYLEENDYQKAFFHLSEFIHYQDSITNADLVRKLANQRTEYEIGLKQAELDLLEVQSENQRLILIGQAVFLGLFIIVIIIIYKYYLTKKRLSNELTQQKAELQTLNSTKDKFFSIISHDLRSPVSAFMGVSRMIKMLVERKQTDELLEMTKEIDKSVDRLSELLDNLLNWAMQQQGYFPYVPEKIYSSELIENIVSTFSNMATGKKISLSFKSDDSIELWADRNSTATIIRNLVNNALKFTNEGGKVEVAVSKTDQQAEITISDNGVGIPEEKLANIFNLEAKKGSYGTKGEKGLGLGLQLVKEFVDLNQGDIQIESGEGKGTIFKIYLPLFQEQLAASDSMTLSP